MSVYFCNEDPIDLDVIRIMGVSVKTQNNPIGYFGTGLKFAISTLIRHGQKFELTRKGERHDIGMVSKTIRGEYFDVITLDGVELGFTTQLGRNWKVWQAYRELHSNCLDENGLISDSIPRGDWGTIIKVDGDLAMDAYAQRSSIFLESQPFHEYSGCDIHDSKSTVGFYRGIRVYQLRKPAIFTYNVKYQQTLTEDRTLSSDYSWLLEVAESIEALSDEERLTTILMANDDTFESSIRFGQQDSPPTDLFRKVCSDHRSSAMLNRTAIDFCNKHEPIEFNFDQIALNQLQRQELDEALKLLLVLECELSRKDFFIVESLGPRVYGFVRDGHIFIDKKTMDKGVRFIASTLYEEWLHKEHGYQDESRELQSMLFEKLLFFVACYQAKQERAASEVPE